VDATRDLGPCLASSQPVDVCGEASTIKTDLLAFQGISERSLNYFDLEDIRSCCQWDYKTAIARVVGHSTDLIDESVTSGEYTDV
jgi:hypothetical protein